jgi:hypothetical protein
VSKNNNKKKKKKSIDLSNENERPRVGRGVSARHTKIDQDVIGDIFNRVRLP